MYRVRELALHECYQSCENKVIMGAQGAKEIFLTLTLAFFLTANVAASDFQLDKVSQNSSVEEGEFLKVGINVTNDGNNGSQIINFTLNGEQKDLMRKNLTLAENESKIIEFDYLVRAGEARENSKFNVSTGTDSVIANLEISTLEKQFKQGWNYFSLPIASQKTYEISEILDESKINSIWMYEGEWKNYYPAASENDFSQFKAGKGYLVDAEDSFTVSPIVQNTVEDTSDVGESVPASEDIETGWNLVGHYWEVEQSSSSALNTLDTQLGQIYTQSQSGSLGIEAVSGNFRTGDAYWIHAGSSSSYARSSQNPRNYQESQLDKIGRIPYINLKIDDGLYDIYRTRPGKLNVTPREGYLGTEDYMTKKEYIEETEVEVEVKDKNKTVLKTCSGVPNENTSFICDLNTSRYNLSQDYTISYEVSRVGSDVKEQQSDQVSVRYPQIPDYRTRLNESFLSEDNLVFEKGLGSINITFEDRDYYRQGSYLNDTQIKNTVEAVVYVKNQTEGSESYYYDENFDRENWTRVCSVETNSNGNILCSLENEDLSFPKKYEVAVNVSTENNLTSNFDSNDADFSVGKMKEIDEKVETSDFWYELNYFQGIISKENNDIRNVEASRTLKNKNISVEQSFDGITTETSFYTDSGASENAEFYGFYELRKGEVKAETDEEEMLASEEPAFFQVTVKEEDTYDESLGKFVYNISNYAQSELALVPESDRYNASEIAENEEVRLNVSNITEGYNHEGNYELSAKMFLENKNMTYNNDNLTEVYLVPLNSNGLVLSELSDHDRIYGPSAEVGQNKTERRGIEVSNTTETEYLLARFDYGNRGSNKPLFVYNVNRSGLE
jgi:hypothetical protein